MKKNYVSKKIFYWISKNINPLMDKDSYFVTKVRIDKQHDLFFRSSQNAVALILDRALGKAPKRFDLNRMTDLEAKVITAFNDFLFEHTSKISLDDIKEAQLKLEEKEQKRIKSPYTIIHKKKMSIFPFVITPIVILLLFIVIYVVVSSINKAPNDDTELKSEIRKEFMINEFTY